MLSEELSKISKTQQSQIDLDAYVKKLISAKNRVTILTNILQGAQDRLQKLQQSIEKETLKRKAALELSEDTTVKQQWLLKLLCMI